MLDRSPLAAYSFTDSKRVHLRVCYQDRSGNIGETFYDSTIGWNVRPDSTIGKADLNNGLAVTGWGNGTQVYELFPVCSFIKYSHGLGTRLLR